MFKYIIKRLALALLILLGVSLIIYILVRSMPFDFVTNKIAALSNNTSLDETAIQTMYEMYGLSDSSFMGIIKGYVQWLGALCRFDFGTSFVYGQPVLDVIVDHMGVSFAVALIATVFEFMIAIPLGITAATHQYSIRDYLVTICVMIGISLPSFFFGQVLKDLLANKLGLFPPSGLVDATASNTGIALLGDYFMHMFIPILTVVILSIGGRMRMTRTNMLEVLNSDYIRTARAKGLREKTVIYSHAWRNALIPVVTLVIGWFLGIFSGSLMIENIFALNGIGRVYFDSLTRSDNEVVLALQLFYILISLLGNLITDIAYGFVDPRVRVNK